MREVDQRQTASGRIRLPHQQFDIVAKDVIYTFPEDVLRFIMGRADIQFLEHVESEFATVEKREMDSLIKVLLDHEPVLVHCEFQAGDSTGLDMARRNVGYLGRCYEKYGLPIFSHVIYLGPNAGRNDPGGYRQDVAGYSFIVEYKVIRLIEVDGQSILEARQPGLMPFSPLMKPPIGMNALQWVHQCIETTKSLSLNSPTLANLLVDLWVMSGLAHEREPITRLFPEDIMQESSVYQYIIEKGRAQGIEQGIELGERRNAVESILELLRIRFSVGTIETLKPTLDGINDLQQLKQLLREAAQAENLEAFIHTLETYSNSA